MNNKSLRQSLKTTMAAVCNVNIEHPAQSLHKDIQDFTLTFQIVSQHWLNYRGTVSSDTSVDALRLWWWWWWLEGWVSWGTILKAPVQAFSEETIQAVALHCPGSVVKEKAVGMPWDTRDNTKTQEYAVRGYVSRSVVVTRGWTRTDNTTTQHGLLSRGHVQSSFLVCWCLLLILH